MKELSKSQLEKQYTDEATLLRKTKEWLESQRDVMFIRINDRYATGYSDIFLCVNGIFCAIELKDDTGKATIHQLLFIEQVVKHGGIGIVARTLGESVEVVNKARSISNGR